MKRYLFIFFLVNILALPLVAQDIKSSQIATTSIHNDAAKFLLFPTQNYYIFLKLNTRTGEVYMVQYSMEEDKRGDIKIDSWQYPLAKDKEQINGRFFLYPTTNMYNFLLLDQIDGRVWQVQWHFEKEKRILTRIFRDTKMYTMADSIKINELEYHDNVYWKDGELFNGAVFSNDGLSLLRNYLDGRVSFGGLVAALHDSGKIAFSFNKLEEIENEENVYQDEDGNKISLEEFKKKYPLIIPRVRKAIKDFQ